MIARTIKKEIIKSVKNRPVTLITGARQVGKSTICYELKNELGFAYVSLDDIRLREEAINDPELFLEIHHWPIIIDEIQHAPKLFSVIEAIVNKQKMETGSNYGMFILTGSETYELLSGVSESLAGRVSIIRMSPLSMREIKGQEENIFFFDPLVLAKRSEQFILSTDELFKTIVRGMYPELYANEQLNSETFYADYVATYIERDVSKIINLKDKLKFYNFIEVLASLTGEELIYDKLAKAIGVSLDTIKAWISVLVAGDIIYLLEPYNEISLIKRVVKRPKIYFNDTGLACYLAHLNDEKVLMKSIFKGRFIETYIVNEIKKTFRNNGRKENFYYYRDSNQNEIDLVILENGTLHFVECKSGIKFDKKDAKAFKQLATSSYQIGYSFIVCNTPSLYKIDDLVYAVPISSI